MIPHGFAKDGEQAAKLAILAGSDMDMESYLYVTKLAQLVESGEVDEALIDDAVRRILRVKNEREIALKESENKRALMKLKNEKLQQDIESKNRELAISTMSLIKKNEFLNSIKSELNNHIQIDKDIKKVIKIIDRNLNSNDDWKFFEEAFNNADKDFFKKIKSNHPTLTPDDLRLCAYLRLNLSSKEIAPLFNISPKSVEVKRYRIRKKMNLPNETNLTNYILEI